MAENVQDNSDNFKNTGSRPSSAAKGESLHWFAMGPSPVQSEEDREARIKFFKEKQNEERQKKLEELKAQALAAQRFKEQKELERRQRLEDLRLKEDAKRLQVEERKRAITEAERYRLESIIKRNEEREARIEARRKTESRLGFAFGSSTPRLLEPVDSTGSFWGHRRATSTQNITSTAMAPLTRRQSEREFDTGNKKRATSAGGVERSEEGFGCRVINFPDMRLSTSMYEILHWGQGTNPINNPVSPTQSFTTSTTDFGNSTPQTPAGCASGYVGRRRTDLMPTIPSREARDSPSTTPRKPFTRSPGRAYSMSRLDQLAKPRKRPADLPPVAERSTSPLRPLSRPHQSSVSRSMSHLAVGSANRLVRKADSNSVQHLAVAPAPVPPPRTTRAMQLRQQKLAAAMGANAPQAEAPSRPSSSLSHQSTSSVGSSVNMRIRPVATPRKPRPISIAVTGISSEIKNGMDAKKAETKPPLPKTRKSSLVKSQEKLKKSVVTSPTEESQKPISPQQTPVPVTNTNNIAVVDTKVETEKTSKQYDVPEETKTEVITKEETVEVVRSTMETIKADDDNSQEAAIETNTNNEKPQDNQIEETKPVIPLKPQVDTHSQQFINNEKAEISKIETIVSPEKPVEQQPAASSTQVDVISEDIVDMTASMIKTRINTEEEAKAALAERRRLAREEAERQAEMERLRKEEEERLELERQQREEEQQRILIEQMKLAEQERLQEAIKEAQRREEEERIKREEENKMRILKEEADRKAREEAERMKAELAERLKNEEKEREARRKRVEAIMLRTRGKNNAGSQQQNEDKNDENKSEKMNGSKIDGSENGHKNGKDIETVDNIINVDSIKNANTVTVDTLGTDDTINSNNSWQHNNQDLLM